MVCLLVRDRCCFCWTAHIIHIYFKCPYNGRVFAIFQPRQHILAEVKKTNRRLQHWERSSLFWRPMVALSPTKASVFLSDFRFISLALLSEAGQIQAGVTSFSPTAVNANNLEEKMGCFKAKRSPSSRELAVPTSTAFSAFISEKLDARCRAPTRRTKTTPGREASEDQMSSSTSGGAGGTLKANMASQDGCGGKAGAPNSRPNRSFSVSSVRKIPKHSEAALLGG